MEEHHRHQHGSDGTDESAMAELLDLEAEVLHSYLSDVTAWISELAGERPPQRVLDLGSGTGAGTFALLERFEGADVTAVDQSAYLLRHLTGKARASGLQDRVRAVEADLDSAWPPVGIVDLVWASSSLHHMAEPDRVLAEVREGLRRGGVLALLELDSFPRFLPDDVGVGRPGLEERCHATLDEIRAVEVPLLGTDWGPRLTKAGFTIEAQRTFTIDLRQPLPAATARYAEASLRRMRPRLEEHLSAEDRAALDRILDGDGPERILRRDDLSVRATRTGWLVRRT